jgi:hypothetical protein
MFVLLPVDRVQAGEHEEQVGVDSFHVGAVGHDQAGVDPRQRAAGEDDRDLLDRPRSGSLGLGVVEYVGRVVLAF